MGVEPLYGNGWSRLMHIAILGQGNVGLGLGKRLTGKVNLLKGARQPKADELSYADAVQRAEVVVLAVPYEAALQAARTLELAGKIVIDVSNPVTPDYMNLTLGYSTSAAEEIQRAAPGSKVVKAFNTVFATLFDLPSGEISKVPVFVAGDDVEAVTTVADLASTAGFKVERSGALEASRLLEPMGVFNIRMAYALGKGPFLTPDWLILKSESA
jgi:predicted dinucleotide-binding enzyme